MFVRLSLGYHKCYEDGNGGSFLGKDARVCVNLLLHYNIKPTLSIQVDISPRINTFSWDGTYVRTGRVTRQTLLSLVAKKYM